ncbi:Putative alpha/beta hydrolase-1 [Septoria linicola]|uniref:Alpha/beta hydrolase-1 n=1 Tax=Septoria linicola TaxID=215465 RepID=A0A9Q9AMY1_9PEZI|nr:putative alpha/beta hydrolase-1 [Septoria linicola]USW51084.1 Putative alpha/beta hydrolase-1 [Septoria linicola]
MGIGRLLAQGAGLAYGLFYLLIALCYALTQKDFWAGETPERKATQDRASRSLWSLQEGLEGIRHKFLKLQNGVQLHYLLADRSNAKTRALVIFLHGFPDSAHLFSRQLRSSIGVDTTLVALDLPGCGGSDSLDRYGPDDVLNVVAEAIVLLKKRYIAQDEELEVAEKPRCILVGHDWGGVIGFRLAAETSGLIDHFVPINSLHPAFAESQLKGRVAKANTLFKQWKLQSAFAILAPVLSQLTKSSYTYMLTLPLPLAKLIPGLTLSLIKFAHSLEYEDTPPPSIEEVATRMAMACGPGQVESRISAEDGSAYGLSVYERSRTAISGDWDGRVKLYAQGLLRRPWTPNYPGHVSLTENSGRFNCAVSFIFGIQDIALNPRIAVDGIERLFMHVDNDHDRHVAQQSRVVRLPDCGHWSLLEEDGERALQEVLVNLLP